MCPQRGKGLGDGNRETRGLEGDGDEQTERWIERRSVRVYVCVGGGGSGEDRSDIGGWGL